MAIHYYTQKVKTESGYDVYYPKTPAEQVVTDASKRFTSDTEMNGKAASSHTHNASDINAGTLPVNRGGTSVSTVAGQSATQRKVLASPKSTTAAAPSWTALDKNDVGLGNVDNTSDANKPISTATQNVLDKKQSRFIDCTTATAASTAAKVVTISDYTLTVGDVFVVTFTNGNTANSPTININGTGAKAVRLGGSAPTSDSGYGAAYCASGGVLFFRYDGTYMRQFGSADITDSNTTNVSSVYSSVANQFLVASNSAGGTTTYYPFVGFLEDGTVDKITATSNTNAAGTRAFTSNKISLVENILVSNSSTIAWTAGAPCGNSLFSRRSVGTSVWQYPIGQYYNKSGVLTNNTTTTDLVQTPLYVGGTRDGNYFAPKEFALTLRSTSYVYKRIGFFTTEGSFHFTEHQKVFVYVNGSWREYLGALDKYDVGLDKVDNTADSEKSVSKAETLAVSRTIRTNLASTSTASFNGSANITPGVTGTLSIGNGGTGVATVAGQSSSQCKVLASPKSTTAAAPSWTALDKNDVGLGNVDNTSDASKNVAYAGNAGTATKLSSSKTISLTGDVTGSVNSDLSGNVSIATTQVANKSNQKVAVSKNSTTATGTRKQVNFKDGSNVTVTVADNATNDAVDVTIAATDTTYSAATTSAAGLMSAADKTKLNGIATSANNYSHPTGDGNLHVPTTGTSNNGKVLKAGSTAGSLSWGTLTASDVGAAATSHGNHVPTTQTASNSVFLRNDNSWQSVTPANIGAAASSHTHNASDINAGTLPVSRGGTNYTGTPSIITNLASTSGASPYAASPRPGVTGTLPIKNGGTGATTAAAALTALGAEPVVSFFYHCTGTNDNQAISNIVNNFLNATGDWDGTTALTMKLVVSGDVGLTASPIAGSGTSADPYYFFSFASSHPRNPRVHIDWSDARIPPISSGSTVAGIYQVGSPTIYHDNLTITISSSSSTGYCIFHDSGNPTYISNSCCDAKSTFPYGVYNNSSGTVYISNSYFYSDGTGGGYNVFNSSSGTVYISNSYCSSSSSSGGTSNVFNSSSGTVYISNSYCYSNGAGGGSKISVFNNSSGTVYISNSYCCSDGSNTTGGGATSVECKSGTVCISNSYCYATSSSTSQGGAAVRVSSYGTIYISNSLCIGISTSSSASTASDSYGLYMGNTSTDRYSKVVAQNCCFRGYRHTSNTSGVGYGVGTNTSSGGQYNIVVLIGCVFNRETIANETQTGDIQLGSSSTIVPKYHIQGCIFYNTTISIGGSSISSVTAAAGKYMPANANIFGQTT